MPKRGYFYIEAITTYIHSATQVIRATDRPLRRQPDKTRQVVKTDSAPTLKYGSQ